MAEEELLMTLRMVAGLLETPWVVEELPMNLGLLHWFQGRPPQRLQRQYDTW